MGMIANNSVPELIDLLHKRGKTELANGLKTFQESQTFPEGLKGDSKEEALNNYNNESQYKSIFGKIDNPAIVGFINTCTRGDLEIAKWIYSTFKLTNKNIIGDADMPLHEAIANGHLNMVKYMFEELEIEPGFYNFGYESYRSFLPRIAAENNRLDIFKYVVKRLNITDFSNFKVASFPPSIVNYIKTLQHHDAVEDTVDTDYYYGNQNDIKMGITARQLRKIMIERSLEHFENLLRTAAERMETFIELQGVLDADVKKALEHAGFTVQEIPGLTFIRF